MRDASYCQATAYHFGLETDQLIGQEVKKHTDKVLLHYGRNSIKRHGIYDKVVHSLKASGVEFYELGGVLPNTDSRLIYEGIQLCREHDIDFILAVGGGSVMDSAKAISVGVGYDGDFFDLFLQEAKPETALKMGFVVTVPGSGSEASYGSVVTDYQRQEKAVCDTPLLSPTFVILNPTHTLSLSPSQTSCGIVDAISHLLERYFSPTDYVDCTDRMCEGLMMTLMKYGRLVLSDPENVQIRGEIMWACKMAQDQIINFGRQQDWGCHKIAHEVGAFYDVSHGALVNVIFLQWMERAAKERPERFIQLGERIFGLDFPQASCAMRTVEAYRAFLLDLGMATTLSELGIKQDIHFDAIAKKAVRYMGSGTIGNYIRLAPDDIVTLLKQAV
ncbi:iron-containing alcohol dehydrogenase [Terasakiella sp. SH-1]|uniref:iron-containing alcohol dehydrogenase n=1 Tax=Terasakiella sp. SH-1 TaxID=2560057 RepID=UPI0010730ED9|nr:iron-containing alcohol dehydrogenase [Terasakiella sp. SH-1]